MSKPLEHILNRLNIEDSNRILGHAAMSGDGEAIGHIKDFLFDDAGRIRYLVVETGFWIFGKQIRVPVEMAHLSDDREEVILSGLTRQRVENWPNYTGNDPVADDLELALLTGEIPRPVSGLESAPWTYQPELRNEGDEERG